MSQDLVLGLLGGGSLATLASTVVIALFNRRKLSAETVELITKAASGVVADLRQQVKDERADHDYEVSELKARLDRLIQEWRDERASVRRTLQLHVAWDMMAIAKLAEAGVEFGVEPPPLLPRRRANLEEL